MAATELAYVPVVVIGGGFSGLAMGAQLKRKLGLDDYVIYERSKDFGGTWFANTYPGCGVDIPSIFYSLSFAPNPNFTKFFPDQPEILAYIHQLAKDFDVERHIRLNTSWDSGVWQEDKKTWRIRISDVHTGQKWEQECSILISAVGGLVNPNPCDIPGVETFKGPVVHTARWPKPGELTLKDKDVIVVGNGCSGSQLVPAVAPEVKSLTQFIRSPQVYLYRPNPTIPIWLRKAFKYVPFLLLAVRWFLFNFLEYTFLSFYVDARGERHRQRMKRLSDHYVETVAPKEYWDMLKPKYMIGCKRRVFDPGYLKSLTQENIHLTDDPIERIVEDGVLTKSGGHTKGDVIVLATGFSLTSFNLDIIGRNGATLREHWAQFGGIEAYKSTACSSFPNFFFIFGPNSAVGHTSVLFTIESNIDLIIKIAKPVIMQKALDVEVKLDYEKEYCEKQQDALRKRVWNDCRSYYKDSTGWNFTLYPHSMYTLWRQARFPEMAAWTYNKIKVE